MYRILQNFRRFCLIQRLFIETEQQKVTQVDLQYCLKAFKSLLKMLNNYFFISLLSV